MNNAYLQNKPSRPGKTFNAIIFTGEPHQYQKGFVKYRHIRNLNRFKTFVDHKFPNWKFLTLYDRYDNTKRRIIRGDVFVF